MFARRVVLAAGCLALAFGCAEPPDETQEIVSNLEEAGFPANDIQVFDGKVYVGRDAHVTLEASREMLAPGHTTREQYRTNRISASLAKICINGSTFTGNFSTALDLAIQNYDELPLAFDMARTPSTGCSFTINAVIDPNMNGGSAGFPTNGHPYGTVTIGGQLAQYNSVDLIEHVITHEIGHTLGFRHSDYYNRNISCGSSSNPDEGASSVGAIHIPGTPTTATVGTSIMNSCFRTSESGEFTASDLTALTAMFTGPFARLDVNVLSESTHPDEVYRVVENSVSFWADRNYTVPVTLTSDVTLQVEYTEEEFYQGYVYTTRQSYDIVVPAGNHQLLLDSDMVTSQCWYDYGTPVGACYERSVWIYDGIGYSVAQ